MNFRHEKKLASPSGQDFSPRWTSIQCPVVFEVAHVDLEPRKFAAGDVGRIGDDQIKGPGLRGRCKVLGEKRDGKTKDPSKTF